MTNSTLEPRVEKLPTWAQQLIRNLQSERDTAVRELHEWTDSQTKSPFSIMEVVSDGEQRSPAIMTRYIQTRRIKCDHAGVSVELSVVRDGDPNRNSACVEIRLGLEDSHCLCEVGLFATHFNQYEVRAVPRKAKQ